MGANTQATVPPASTDDRDRDDLANRLATGLAELSLVLAPAAQSRLLNYVELLSRWNRTFNLTAVRQPIEMIDRHLIDSLSIVDLVDRVAGRRPVHFVDVGTGAGLPGIPLAISRPDLSCTLVEASGKKAAFLRQCVAALPLASVTVCHARVETLRASALDRPVDLIVSRAFSSIRDLLDMTASLVGPDTVVIAMKGPNADTELDELERAGLADSPHGSWARLANSHKLLKQKLNLPTGDVVRQAIVIAPNGRVGAISGHAGGLIEPVSRQP